MGAERGCGKELVAKGIPGGRGLWAGPYAHKARQCKNWVSAGMMRAVHTAQLLQVVC